MKRSLISLAALLLAITLTLGLSVPALAAEARSETVQAEYAGYLVTLEPALSDPTRPSLFEVEEVAVPECLYPLDEELGIYKAASLYDVRALVYAGRVAVLEPDYKAELFEVTATPQDQYYLAQGYQYGLYTMDVQAAWDVGLSGNGVTVAVIDSGLNITHKDVPQKVVPGRFFYYEEAEDGRYELPDPVTGEIKTYNYYSSNLITDDHAHGHGTMVTGIIAANTNNVSEDYPGGIAGIAHGASIMPIRCFTNMEGRQGGYASNLISGLNYARTHGADIINMSWGILANSDALKEAIDAAYNAGCILIAAAGNDSNSATRYPAAYSNVISVGATDQDDLVCSFSQRVTTTDISAPGYGIYSIYNSNNTSIGYGHGTSFSAPAVTAVAALLKEAHPSLTHTDFARLLADPNNSKPLGSNDYAAYGGAGVINVKKLLDAVGYAGLTLSLGAEGLVARASVHPQLAPNEAAPEVGRLFLIGAYNAQGHLLQSAVCYASGQNAYTIQGVPNVSYGGWSGQCVFSDLADVASVKAFFLSESADLSAAIPHVEKGL